MVPVIDVFKCDGCGVCIKQCPPQIMGLIKGRAALLADLCEECLICADVCPIHAVLCELPKKEIERVFDAYCANRADIPGAR